MVPQVSSFDETSEANGAPKQVFPSFTAPLCSVLVINSEL